MLFAVSPPHSAPFVLAGFAAVGLVAAVLYQSGALGLILRIVYGLANQLVFRGYRVWDRWLSSLSWEGLAGILVVVHLLRWPFEFPPLITAGLGAVLLTIGALTVL